MNRQEVLMVEAISQQVEALLRQFSPGPVSQPDQPQAGRNRGKSSDNN